MKKKEEVPVGCMFHDSLQTNTNTNANSNTNTNTDTIKKCTYPNTKKEVTTDCMFHVGFHCPHSLHSIGATLSNRHNYQNNNVGVSLLSSLI